jgi:hypothetical protein
MSQCGRHHDSRLPEIDSVPFPGRQARRRWCVLLQEYIIHPYSASQRCKLCQKDASTSTISAYLPLSELHTSHMRHVPVFWISRLCSMLGSSPFRVSAVHAGRTAQFGSVMSGGIVGSATRHQRRMPEPSLGSRTARDSAHMGHIFSGYVLVSLLPEQYDCIQQFGLYFVGKARCTEAAIYTTRSYDQLFINR